MTDTALYKTRRVVKKSALYLLLIAFAVVFLFPYVFMVNR